MQESEVGITTRPEMIRRK